MLTDEEQKEFTYLNFLSHTLARQVAGETRIPAWLTTSDDAKQEMRQKAVDWMNQNLNPIVPYSLTSPNLIENAISSTPIGQAFDQWKQVETEMKAERDKGNPAAYFASNAQGK